MVEISHFVSLRNLQLSDTVHFVRCEQIMQNLGLCKCSSKRSTVHLIFHDGEKTFIFDEAMEKKHVPTFLYVRNFFSQLF